MSYKSLSLATLVFILYFSPFNTIRFFYHNAWTVTTGARHDSIGFIIGKPRFKLRVAQPRYLKHFSPLLCSGPLGAGAWLACRAVRICAWRYGFTSTFCSSSLRRREPKRKEAHGDCLSFHPYAFYLFVKVLSLYNVASWKNASLTSFAIWPRRRRHGCRDSLDRRRSSFVAFTLVFRKENLMAYKAFKAMASLGLLCCGGCAIRDKTAMEHLVCHEARSPRYAIITSISTSYARSRSIDHRCTPVCDERNNRKFALQVPYRFFSERKGLSALNGTDLANFEDQFWSWTCVHLSLTCVRVRKECSVGKTLHVTPNLEEILPKLNGAKYLSNPRHKERILECRA